MSSFRYCPQIFPFHSFIAMHSLSDTVIRMVIIFTLILDCLSSPRNLTIDDQTGDEITGLQPTYSPPNGWSQGNGCSYCTAKADPSGAFGGTWHDGRYVPGQFSAPYSFTLQFNGLSFYVFYGFCSPECTAAQVQPYGSTVYSKPGSIPRSRSLSMVKTQGPLSSTMTPQEAYSSYITKLSSV